jgi:restriction system protein
MFNLILTILITALLGYYIFKYKKELTFEKGRVTDLLSTNDEMKKTLLVGLYHRFKISEEEKEENPWLFEQFVSQIMQDYYDSNTYVTQASNDFGVDIEETREDGLYLGQVKCYAEHNFVGYEPIAIIHSQMVKQNAKGGYVVTTSSYTQNARSYAAGLNIELIDGKELVDLWVKGLEKKKGNLVGLTEPEISV